MNKTNDSDVPKSFDNITIGALADAFEKDFITIKRWVAANDDRLTSEKAREVYRTLAHVKKSDPVRKTA